MRKGGMKEGKSGSRRRSEFWSSISDNLIGRDKKGYEEGKRKDTNG